MKITGCIAALSGRCRRLWRDRRGSYSILAALLLPVLTGFTAFGTEVGLWFHTHQRMQGSADAAAFSAATARAMGATGFAGEGRTVAARHGFAHGDGGTEVVVNRPPASGPNTANPEAVEVVIRQTQPRLFTALLSGEPVSISARAVAVGVPAIVVCILGLDPSAAQTVRLSNNAELPNPDCAVASNSSAADAVALSNNASIHSPVSSHGGISLANNAELLGNPNLTQAAPVADPYATADPGSPPACTTQNGSGTNNGSRTLRPDVVVGGVGMARFCSGFNFRNNFQVTLEPGIYFVDSQLVFGNNAVISGTGVTLVVNGNYAVDIGNNANVALTAPSAGPTAGIVFFGRRDGTATVQQTFSNNTVLDLNGAIYFPNQIINFNNNATTGGDGCTQVIGRLVRLSNNVNLNANCAGLGTTPMHIGGRASLIE